MKRSLFIAIGIVQAVAAAALAAGCGSKPPEQVRDWDNCVDRDGRVVSDQQCRQEQPAIGRTGYVPFYHWYYTRGYRALPIGQPAAGGSLTRPSSGAPVHPGAFPSVTRGGFGSIGSGHPAAGA